MDDHLSIETTMVTWGTPRFRNLLMIGIIIPSKVMRYITKYLAIKYHTSYSSTYSLGLGI